MCPDSEVSQRAGQLEHHGPHPPLGNDNRHGTPPAQSSVAVRAWGGTLKWQAFPGSAETLVGLFICRSHTCNCQKEQQSWLCLTCGRGEREMEEHYRFAHWQPRSHFRSHRQWCSPCPRVPSCDDTVPSTPTKCASPGPSSACLSLSLSPKIYTEGKVGYCTEQKICTNTRFSIKLLQLS